MGWRCRSSCGGRSLQPGVTAGGGDPRVLRRGALPGQSAGRWQAWAGAVPGEGALPPSCCPGTWALGSFPARRGLRSSSQRPGHLPPLSALLATKGTTRPSLGQGKETGDSGELGQGMLALPSHRCTRGDLGTSSGEARGRLRPYPGTLENATVVPLREEASFQECRGWALRLPGQCHTPGTPFFHELLCVLGGSPVSPGRCHCWARAGAAGCSGG